MATFISAHLSDMDECRKILEDLSADVTQTLASMDDFLNTRAEVNGTAIFANWQSQARTIFVQKVGIVIDSFKAISQECLNGAEILKIAINSYSEADRQAAGLSDAVDIVPVNFDFSGASK